MTMAAIWPPDKEDIKTGEDELESTEGSKIFSLWLLENKHTAVKTSVLHLNLSYSRQNRRGFMA
jgi:hypothetical protein